MAPEAAAPEARREGGRRRSRLRALIPLTAVLLLFAVPGWMLVGAPGWPPAGVAVGTALFAAGLVGMPLLMFRGHARADDLAARTGDTLLGVIWVLFTWSVAGGLVRAVLYAVLPAGADGTAVDRWVALGIVAVSAVLLAWGCYEAMRVPRIRRVEVPLHRLPRALDGLRLVVITDTHYGPIDRTRWSVGVAEAVNSLDADVLCHAGDIADGPVANRLSQSAPLASMRAKHGKVFVTGNHEYYGDAPGWVERLTELGWQPLHNSHLTIRPDAAGGAQEPAAVLVVAGVDDHTAADSGLPGHREDLDAALDGVDPGAPVVLLAHQPKQIANAADRVDLQISGHTHGGQIWPFHLLVRIDQPVVAGLSSHGSDPAVRTRLYTSRGTGFWGPPFRVFAPSEITLLVLRAPAGD
ncbi:metallophosphoesterase [Phaeacidiphilus oryzae]|uniref:metallophosphoesterase n=1 Tax=Phaeacidiphilus oryzae TaxID=348818 RepID=UPI0005698A4E|nr:metallophosphoesterase [Phaeacidiphilus oryzae]